MQKQRLLKLANFLRTVVPAKRFDLTVIGRQTAQVVEIAERPVPTNPECGFAGCAIGWTPSAFPRSGWKIKSTKYDWSDKLSLDATYTDSKGEEYRDFEGAEKFYGLTEKEASFLFQPYSYPSDRQGRISVAKRIEKFVATDGKIAENHKDYYYY